MFKRSYFTRVLFYKCVAWGYGKWDLSPSIKVRVLWYGVNLDRLSLKSFEFSLLFKFDNLLNHMYKSFAFSIDIIYESMHCISMTTSATVPLSHFDIEEAKCSLTIFTLLKALSNNGIMSSFPK